MSKKKSDRKSIKDKNNIFFPNMKKSYLENVVPSLVSRFSYSNNLQFTSLKFKIIQQYFYLQDKFELKMIYFCHIYKQLFL